MRERNRDDRLVEEPWFAVVGDHEAIPAPPLGDEFPQGRQAAAPNCVRGFYLDRHETDVPLEDEIDLSAGRGPVEKRSAVGPRRSQPAADVA